MKKYCIFIYWLSITMIFSWYFLKLWCHIGHPHTFCSTMQCWTVFSVLDCKFSAGYLTFTDKDSSSLASERITLNLATDEFLRAPLMSAPFEPTLNNYSIDEWNMSDPFPIDSAERRLPLSSQYLWEFRRPEIVNTKAWSSTVREFCVPLTTGIATQNEMPHCLKHV